MKRSRAAVALVAALALGIPALGGAEPSAKRKPKNALEDIDRIGRRNVTGVLNLFTLRQEVELGSALARQVNERVQLIDDPAITEYVNRIGQNIARNSDVKVPLTIKVLRDETVNAFALPGGFFYVNTGLILAARDEAELAGVMGHEIAHIAGRHGVRQASRGMLVSLTADILLEAFGGDNWGTVVAVTAANIALPVTFLKFSREFEKKADFLGMQYLYKTGYDPLAMVSFFERLSAREKKTGFIAAAFRTHPLSSKRVMLLQKAIDELLPDQPSYMVSASEFDAVKARIAELHGISKKDPDDPERPELLRRLSGADGASKEFEDAKEQRQAMLRFEEETDEQREALQAEVAMAAAAQEAAEQEKRAKQPLTNEEISLAVQGELPEEIILARIEASDCGFDLSIEALAALHEAGVPKSVITAMIACGQ